MRELKFITSIIFDFTGTVSEHLLTRGILALIRNRSHSTTKDMLNVGKDARTCWVQSTLI